jgi:hypothetical protein
VGGICPESKDSQIKVCPNDSIEAVQNKTKRKNFFIMKLFRMVDLQDAR